MSSNYNSGAGRHPALRDMRHVPGTTIPQWEWDRYLKHNPGATVASFLAACKEGAKQLYAIVLEMDARVEANRKKRLGIDTETRTMSHA
jgi:predicted dienelactone hydrolase